MDQKPFDRKAHCRRIASKGGRTTVARHGSSHMSAIGVKGFQATAKHFRSTRQYKNWLASMGAFAYWRSVGLPDTGKFSAELPAAPWDDRPAF
jgi:hypothetical protein